MAETSELVTLRQGDYELELCPKGGGCITAFRYRGLDVMRSATKGYWLNFEPRCAGSFPLVPYSNRIADGRFTYDNRTYRLPINMPPEPHAIHGDGWHGAWTVETESASEAILVFEPKEAAIAHRSRQLFKLDDEGLTVMLELTNSGLHPLPFGFGHHPYFPRTDGMSLKATVSGVWLPDERNIPKDKIDLPPDWDFNRQKRLAALDLDNCFAGFEGKAAMHWPETGLSLVINADPIFGHLVVFVPPGEDFVCVEPVSHVTNGIHQLINGRDDTGLRVLQPSETLRGRMSFSATLGTLA